MPGDWVCSRMKRGGRRSGGAEGGALDLHGMRVAEALRVFVQAYNQRVARGDGSPLRVIHGYGSSGGEGAIGRELRRFLERHADAATFMAGEDFSINPGFTVVYPRKRLPPPVCRPG